MNDLPRVVADITDEDWKTIVWLTAENSRLLSALPELLVTGITASGRRLNA